MTSPYREPYQSPSIEELCVDAAYHELQSCIKRGASIACSKQAMKLKVLAEKKKKNIEQIRLNTIKKIFNILNKEDRDGVINVDADVFYWLLGIASISRLELGQA